MIVTFIIISSDLSFSDISELFKDNTDCVSQPCLQGKAWMSDVNTFLLAGGITHVINQVQSGSSVTRKYQAHQDFFIVQLEPSTETTSLVAGWFQMAANIV